MWSKNDRLQNIRVTRCSGTTRSAGRIRGRDARSQTPSFPVAIGEGSHPFPFRTRKLSLLPPMVLRAQVRGRVGRCRGLNRPSIGRSSNTESLSEKSLGHFSCTLKSWREQFSSCCFWPASPAVQTTQRHRLPHRSKANGASSQSNRLRRLCKPRPSARSVKSDSKIPASSFASIAIPALEPSPPVSTQSRSGRRSHARARPALPPPSRVRCYRCSAANTRRRRRCTTSP